MYRPPPLLRGRCRRDGFPKRDFHVPGRGAHALQDLLLILYLPPNFLEGLTTALPNLPSRPQVNRLMDLIVNSLYSNKDVRSCRCAAPHLSALPHCNCTHDSPSFRLKPIFAGILARAGEQCVRCTGQDSVYQARSGLSDNRLRHTVAPLRRSMAAGVVLGRGVSHIRPEALRCAA